MREIILPELSYKITGLCFQVHGELKRFCRERQYADKLEDLLQHGKLIYKREFEIKGIDLSASSGNRVDFLIENLILLDLKAKNFITKEDYFQMKRYLIAAGLKLGLIVNFRAAHLKPKRVINSYV